jgi:hypothetical protein
MNTIPAETITEISAERETKRGKMQHGRNKEAQDK